jgi:excisionase family DNA binding protein
MLDDLQFLTVKETADYLKVTPNTIMIWARSGRIPAVKMGRQWRVVKSEFDRWVVEQSGGKHPGRSQ